MLKNRAHAWLLVILPILALSLPLLQMTLRFVPDFNLKENRVLEPFPTFAEAKANYAKFRTDAEKYLNDHFGFRSHLLLFNSVLKYEIFGAGANPRVAIGKNGWLFLQDFPADIRHSRAMTEGELEFWRAEVERRDQWAAARNSQYFFLIAPAKSSIYPQYLPDRLRPRDGTESRTDQLLSYLRKHSHVRVIDTRPALRAAAGRAQSYYTKDLHWNNFGGFSAAQLLFQTMSKGSDVVAPFRDDEFELRNQPKTRYPDLAGLLSLQTYLGFDDEVDVQLRANGRIPRAKGSFRLPLGYNTRVSEAQGGSSTNTVMFSDSFGIAMFEYLAARLGRVYAVESGDMPFFPEIVEREAPKFVIDLMVEDKLSYLPQVPNKDLDERANEFWKQAFAESVAQQPGSVRVSHGQRSGVLAGALLLPGGAACHVAKLAIEAEVGDQLRIATMSRQLDGAYKKGVVVRKVRQGNNELFVPFCGNQRATFDVVRSERSSPSLISIELRPWSVEAIDKEKIVSEFAGLWGDRWTQQEFGWQPRFLFDQAILNIHVDGHTMPNVLTVSTADGQRNFQLNGGQNRLELPFATRYRFRLARTFVPKRVGIGKDLRELGVVLESVQVK